MAKRLAEVDRNRCAACGACAAECPKKAIWVWKGCYARVEENTCVGCGKCAKICPAGCVEIKAREELA